MPRLERVMAIINKQNKVSEEFFVPVETYSEKSENRRNCPELKDEEWMKTGILRAMSNEKSGRGFLEKQTMGEKKTPGRSSFFGNLKSERRLKYVKSVKDSFLEDRNRKALEENTFGEVFRGMENFHIYGGDGHFHAASCHEDRDAMGRKHAVGHVYSLNLRSLLLNHLTLSGDRKNKKPHDMKVLKSLEPGILRQGAKKGEKVLYVWDRAGIDFGQWRKWKHSWGIYNFQQKPPAF